MLLFPYMSIKRASLTMAALPTTAIILHLGKDKSKFSTINLYLRSTIAPTVWHDFVSSISSLTSKNWPHA